MSRTALFVAPLCLLLHAAGASAQTEGDAPEQKTVASSAGLKLLVGGNLWSTPENIRPAGYEGVGFAGDAGGLGFGAALYYEARFFTHLGLEFDLGYDSSKLLRNVTINGVDTKESVTSSGPRIGLFVKGIANAPFGRLSAGIGPEFVVPTSASADFEVETGQQLDPIEAEKKSSTMLAFVLGMVVEAGDKFEVPIDIKAAKNMTQEADWQDRVKFTNNSYSVVAQNSWDFRLAVGLGYRF
jgi:hypothetical protein